MGVASVEEFAKLVGDIEGAEGYRRPAAYAVGLATFALTELEDPWVIGTNAGVLDTWFPVPNCDENFGSAAILAKAVGHRSGANTYRLSIEQLDAVLASFTPFESDGKAHPNLRAMKQLREVLLRGARDIAAYTRHDASLDRVLPRAVVVTFIEDLKSKPVSAHDAYLRLHLLSSRKVKPHAQNLEGVFGLLSNVVWTNVGAYSPDNFDAVRGILRSQGIDVHVHSVDKFPRMTDYVIPSGVRVADADRVRLGAYLGEGTTVMHEGFVNFNAGTLGKSMVEGRISAGVTVDDGSDVGGGASIMGTLSGGGSMVISLGKSCLLGANSGCGLPLGNGCTIEAGLYVTAGTKVALSDGRVIKARELAGQDDLLFRRNSLTGAVEVVHKKNEIVLNPELHKN